MDNYISNFLQEHFLFGSLCGKHYNGDPQAFFKLGNVFGVAKPTLESLFARISTDDVADVLTSPDYKLYARIKQFVSLTGKSVDPDTDEILSLKGKSINLANQLKLEISQNENLFNIQTNLLAAAERGLVAAMRCVGFMKCEGIVWKKDIASGVKYLTRAAQWGDMNAAIELIYYTPRANKDYAYSLLRASVDSTIFDYVEINIGKRYDIKAEKDPTVLTLKKAFNNGILSVNMYNETCSRFLNSKIVNSADKNAIHYLRDKSFMAAINFLPLDMKYETIKYSGMEPVFGRTQEKQEVDSILKNNDLRKNIEYRPLCLVSDNQHVLKFYLNALRDAFKNERCQVIETSQLSVEDIRNFNENVIKEMSQTQNNVLFFVMKDKLDANEQAIAEQQIANYIYAAKRKKIFMQSSRLTLDLTAVMPIMLCDQQNYEVFKYIVNGVKLADFTFDEIKQAVKYIFEMRCENANVTEYEVQDSVLENLAKQGLEKAELIIERAIMDLRDSKISFTEENMSSYYDGDYQLSNTFGFGGNNNEHK